MRSSLFGTAALVCAVLSGTGCAHLSPVAIKPLQPITLPAQVVASDELSPNEYDALTWAMFGVNCMIGSPVFVGGNDDTRHNSSVHVVEAREMWPLNATWRPWRDTNGGTITVAQRHRERRVEWLVTMFTHKLGHVLGLSDVGGHSASVMHRTLRESQERASWHPLSLSEAEADAVRKLHNLPPPTYDTSNCDVWVERQAAILQLGDHHTR